ncbi:glycosyl hydrolase family 18 protein [Rhodonellum sp.]|uniref:glycosyl hydrolase family 18 protein n=1 Tax=Rhodonellum sp. TaxID=2231180 RepID=UPI00272C3037|nr:glycosyl hydrolase family 18 protein [Rhodonellum sp.]
MDGKTTSNHLALNNMEIQKSLLRNVKKIGKSKPLIIQIVLLGFFWFSPYVAFGQVGPTRIVVVGDSIEKSTKTREGFLNQLVQPFRLRENKKERILKLIRQIANYGDLRVDSTTVNNITKELLDLTTNYELTKKENQDIQENIKGILSDLKSKAPRQVIDSIQNQIGLVLQSLADESKKESIEQRNEILKKLKEIKNIEFKCGIGSSFPQVYQINDSTFVTYQKCLTAKTRVFGWYNSWVKDAYENFNYNYLTDIIYHGYALGPNGENQKPEDLETLRKGSFFKRAAGGNVAFSLSVYSKSNPEIQTFLRSQSAQNLLINRIKELQKSIPIKGINIFFTDLSPGEKDQFSAFIANLKSSFMKESETFLVTITLPAIGESKDRKRANTYDFDQLNKYVDFFMVQTNELTVSHSLFPRAPSPLFSPEGQSTGSISSTLDFYTNGKVIPSKLVLTLTYLGISWRVPDFFGDSPAIGKGKYHKFMDIQKDFRKSGDFFEGSVYGFDPEQLSPYYNYFDDGQMRKIWFEDGNSLYQKYNYALEQSLGGVAIWDLGCDDGYFDLWDALGAALIDVDSVKISERKVTESEKKKRASFFDYLLVYLSDLMWAAPNDIYLGDPYREDWDSIKDSEKYCLIDAFKILSGRYDQYKRDSTLLTDDQRKSIQPMLDLHTSNIFDRNNKEYFKPFIVKLSELFESDDRDSTFGNTSGVNQGKYRDIEIDRGKYKYLDSETQCLCIYTRWNAYAQFHGIATLVMFCLFVLLSLFTFWKIMKKGSDWPWKGRFQTVTFISLVLTLLLFLAYLYFQIDFPYFGAGSDEVPILVLFLIIFFGFVFGMIYQKIKMSKEYEVRDLP